MGAARGRPCAAASVIEPPAAARNPARDSRSSRRDALEGVEALALQRSTDFPVGGLIAARWARLVPLPDAVGGDKAFRTGQPGRICTFRSYRCAGSTKAPAAVRHLN